MSELRIESFNEVLKPWFGRLNRVWLERYFVVEPIDETVLDHPEASILEAGGHIVFALRGEQVLGTCALKYHGDGEYELTKMAVADEAQGQGVGRFLFDAVIEKYRALCGRRLFLESHDSLTPAITLYETGGFVHVPRPGGPSPYERANVYMVFKK
ncbi:MAG: GNAT family N-acetyltransferase [Pseudomonadota bacterium]